MSDQEVRIEDMVSALSKNLVAEYMDKEILSIQQNNKKLNEIIEATGLNMLIKCVNEFKIDEFCLLSLDEQASFAKKVAEIIKTIKDKNGNINIQINQQGLSVEEAKRFDVEL